MFVIQLTLISLLHYSSLLQTMIDELYILLKIIGINFLVSFTASYIGLSNDIRMHNQAVKGEDTEDDTAVITLR